MIQDHRKEDDAHHIHLFIEADLLDSPTDMVKIRSSTEQPEAEEEVPRAERTDVSVCSCCCHTTWGLQVMFQLRRFRGTSKSRRGIHPQDE
ncbi:MAG: hypothetical protein QXQ39_02320 [Conexivisphaerales archaeon]